LFWMLGDVEFGHLGLHPLLLIGGVFPPLQTNRQGRGPRGSEPTPPPLEKVFTFYDFFLSKNLPKFWLSSNLEFNHSRTVRLTKITKI